MQMSDTPYNRFGYCRTGVGSPTVTPANVTLNVGAMLTQAQAATKRGARIFLYPELCLTGYTCGDLFYHAALLDAAERGIADFLRATREHATLYIIGAPLRFNHALYNCAVVCWQGGVLGVVPKSYAPHKGDLYESRWFTAAANLTDQTMSLCGFEVPFGSHLLFELSGTPNVTVGVEFFGDLLALTPPSATLATAGATLICTPLSESEWVGRAAARRTLVEAHSERLIAAWALAGAGPGESTTDLLYGGHLLLAEAGTTVAEGDFTTHPDGFILADIDLPYLYHRRRNSLTFSSSASQSCVNLRRIKCVGAKPVPHMAVDAQQPLLRDTPAHPFVPSDAAALYEYCTRLLKLQAAALATRLRRTEMGRAVIGVSGGLDSTLALLAVVASFKQLKLASANIHAITMPGFGTSQATLVNARALCRALGVTLEEIDIKPACQQHLADIGHDGSGDVTYENVQARERTQILMSRANMLAAPVIGTGDLSEVALGWSTFNGDHISMYSVNCGIPKTVVVALIHHYAQHCADPTLQTVLKAIAATPVSPELLPTTASGAIAQQTEKLVGPYELHDFFIHHLLERGAPRAKIAYLANIAFAGRYRAEEIETWLQLFMRRFMRQQFKRSCMPDGPKLLALALSPRSGWRMASDLAKDTENNF